MFVFFSPLASGLVLKFHWVYLSVSGNVSRTAREFAAGHLEGSGNMLYAWQKWTQILACTFPRTPFPQEAQMV
jgi:hypothetical protein